MKGFFPTTSHILLLVWIPTGMPVELCLMIGLRLLQPPLAEGIAGPFDGNYHFFWLRAEAAARAEWLTPYAEAVPPDAAGPAGCPISTASALESKTRPNFEAKFFRVAECIPVS